MVSMIDSTGLKIESKADIIQDLIIGYQGIYGADINVDSNSPDGQLINIQAQAISDFLELLQDTYSNSAVDTSYGTRLDELMALNGIQRKQGTNTVAQVVVTATQAVTIPGLDQTAATPFTIADNAGNQYQLVTTTVFSAAGPQTLAFQSVTIGQIETTPNTITNIVTTILGITTVNNPSTAADQIGVNEESDSQLKIRHAQSLALASTGPSDSLESALHNIPDVVDAIVVENNTGGSVNTIPPFSVWCIVNGGTPTEIAQAIYAKKSPGCGLKGSVSQAVMRPNGSTFTAQWDVALSQPLFVGFSLLWSGPVTLSNDDIATQLADALSYKLGQKPSIGDVVNALRTITPTATMILNSTQGVSSDGSTWQSQVVPSDAQHFFVLAPVDITIT